MEKQYDIFISYSWADSEIATRIYQQLTYAGFNCCYDRESFRGGSDFPKTTAKNINSSRVFLYLGSRNSFNSGWAPDEVAFAKTHKKRETLLFYSIDDSKMPEWMELAFGAINRRNYKEHPVETVLVDDIHQILKNGNSKFTISTQNKKKGCTVSLSIALLCLLILIPTYFLYKNVEKMQESSLDYYIEEMGEIEDTCVYDEVAPIDLGLPSGTLWADRNIGAACFSDFGEYFGWGELTPQTEQSVYIFPDLLSSSLNNSEFDVAKKRLGNDWHIPTPEQWEELYNECIWTWTTINNVNGYRICSKSNSRFIFLPAAGRIAQEKSNPKLFYEVNGAGYYWSSILAQDNHNTIKACLTNFYSGKIDVYASGMVETGRSIRAVR